MATASVTNLFVNNTTANADEVNTNFSDLTSFLNNSTVHRDGSKAFTSNVDAGSNRVINVSTPTSSTDAATKAYVDDNVTAGKTAFFTRSTNISVSAGGSGTVTFESESNDDSGWWSSGTTFTCPATGVYAISLYGLKASGSGLITLQTIAGTGAMNLFVGFSSGATGSGSAGGVFYLVSGQTFTVTYAEEGFTDSVVIDTVVLSITQIATN